MNIGQLDRKGTLRGPVGTAQNDFGGVAPVPFADVATVAVGVAYKPGGEGVEASQLTATQRVQFTLRYRADVRPDWQLVFDGKTFQITDVAEIGRRRGLLLTCYSHG
jgi:SPP1 family predicted phage head-tail adaptor